MINFNNHFFANNLPPHKILESYIDFIKVGYNSLNSPIPINHAFINPNNISFSSSEGFYVIKQEKELDFIDPVLRKVTPDIRDISDEQHMVYSYSALLYYFLTKKIPNIVDIETNKLLPISFEGVEENLANILENGLKIDPFDRYQNLESFINALESFLNRYKRIEFGEIDQYVSTTNVLSKSKLIQLSSVIIITVLCLATATVSILTNLKQSAKASEAPAIYNTQDNTYITKNANDHQQLNDSSSEEKETEPSITDQTPENKETSEESKIDKTDTPQIYPSTESETSQITDSTIYPSTVNKTTQNNNITSQNTKQKPKASTTPKTKQSKTKSTSKKASSDDFLVIDTD